MQVLICECQKVDMIFCIGADWQPNHITLGLFQATNISGQTLTINLIELLDIYELKRKIIIYVKDEGSNQTLWLQP